MLGRFIPGRIKHSRLVRYWPRVRAAMQYYKGRRRQILKWGLSSREETNYTYGLTDRNLEYMAFMVAAASGRSVDEIRGYIQEAASDQELAQHVIQMTLASRFRTFADPRCEFGRRLGWYAMARALKPKTIIETGVDKGHGAVLLCAAVERNRAEGAQSTYYGTDINPEAGYLLDGKYTEFGKILYGDSIESLAAFPEKIDLFINDSDHSGEYEYREYVTVKDKLSKNAVILGDNSHATDSLARFAREEQRQFIFFREEPRDHWYPGAGIGISY